MQTDKINCRVSDLVDILGWEEDDDVVVEFGGTATSGIHQPPEANERWSTPFGVTKYNKDAFIVIKNKSKNPVVPSKPNNCPKCNNAKCDCSDK